VARILYRRCLAEDHSLESRDVSNTSAQSNGHARDPNTDHLSGREKLPRSEPISIDLPPPGTKRWVARRKAAVIAAVRGGALDFEEACRRFELSAEEFHAWERGFESHGIAGLRITRLQIYRDASLLTRRKSPH
jgi:hypothetical protein